LYFSACPRRQEGAWRVWVASSRETEWKIGEVAYPEEEDLLEAGRTSGKEEYWELDAEKATRVEQREVR
jgi:hypothetical protein